jgi:hypothetical protein
LQKLLSSSSIQTGQGTQALRWFWWPVAPVIWVARARLAGVGCRGEEGDREGGLTGGIDEERRPEFVEGRTGCWPRWPARCPAGWGAPADLLRREAAEEARLDVAELPVASAGTWRQRPRRRWRRRTDQRHTTAQVRVAGRGAGHTGGSASAFMGAQEAALACTDAEDGEAPDSGGVLAAAGAGWARMGSARAVGAGWTGLGCWTVVQQLLCPRAGSTSGLQPTGLIGPDWFSWAAGCCCLAEIRGEMKGREQTSRRWGESSTGQK